MLCLDREKEGRLDWGEQFCVVASPDYSREVLLISRGALALTITHKYM